MYIYIEYISTYTRGADADANVPEGALGDSGQVVIYMYLYLLYVYIYIYREMYIY